MPRFPFTDNLAKERGTEALIARRYKLLGRLGSGGGGEVYEAIDSVTDRLRAIKLIDDGLGDEARQRFEREAKIASRVESPSLVEIVDCGHDPAHHVLFLVMERLRGADLGKVLRENGPLAPDCAVSVLAQIAQGLASLHEEGIVHRDVKPENVFRMTCGAGALANQTQVKLLDLGLAKQFQVTTPKTTRALGTPAFMAPEQLRGEATVDYRADIYGYGQLAYTLLVGKAYYERELQSSANLYGLLLSVAEGPREPASVRAGWQKATLPPGFDVWFRRATAPTPGERFSTIAEAHAALAPILSGAPAAVAPRARRSRATTWALAACLVLAAGAVANVIRAAAPRTTEVDHARATHPEAPRDEVEFEARPPSPKGTPSAVETTNEVAAPPIDAHAKSKNRPPSPAKSTRETTGRSPRPEVVSGRDPLDSL